MKQREDILVRKRIKTNNEFRLHDAPLDIFQVHNEEGESLGDILTELREENKRLNSKFDAIDKTYQKILERAIEEVSNLWKK